MPVIRCEGLSKVYRLGERESYKALRDVIAQAAAAPFRHFLPTRSNGHSANENRQSGMENDVAWALDDVSFEVNRGEVVGIIGRNGAGKSTLLKILSRITKPTRGEAFIRGRVGSLLEVGTGFHPELSGRENIYLNGALLGMRKLEIDKKFDEIVAFAEVDKFIDTPVKRYSSGMYVRLAFAVAAHMETEILLIDEVLAVGDAAFQRKCIGRMDDFGKQGRTVLFVSHNLAAIQSLCPRTLLIDGGKTISDGPSTGVIEGYINRSAENGNAIDLTSHPNRHHGCVPLFRSLRILNSEGSLASSIFPGDELIFELVLDPQVPVAQPVLGIGIDNSMGVRVFSVTNEVSGSYWNAFDRLTQVRCTLPHIQLSPGRYWMNISVRGVHGKHIDAISNAGSFEVSANDYFGSGRLPTADLGIVLAKAEWQICKAER